MCERNSEAMTGIWGGDYSWLSELDIETEQKVQSSTGQSAVKT